MPFLGISPFRYRDIFQKGKRKNDDGSAKRWIADVERPMIGAASTAYIEVEPEEFSPLIGAFEPDEQ